MLLFQDVTRLYSPASVRFGARSIDGWVVDRDGGEDAVSKVPESEVPSSGRQRGDAAET